MLLCNLVELWMKALQFFRESGIYNVLFLILKKLHFEISMKLEKMFLLKLATTAAISTVTLHKKN